MAAVYSESGLQSEAASVVPDTVAIILGGVSQESLPETSVTPKGAPPKRQWMARSSMGAGPPSAKRRIFLPQSIPISERPRPDFDRAWAVKGDSENDTAESFHLVGSKGNHGTKSKEGNDPLDDWDAMLKGSCLSHAATIQRI